jgi:hypothetical protein
LLEFSGGRHRHLLARNATRVPSRLLLSDKHWQIATDGAVKEMMARVGIPDDADQCSGHADHRFRDDGDHDS